MGGNTLQFQHIDTIIGGNADDIFVISNNTQYTLFGGGGNDIFRFNSGASLTGVLDGQAGNDTVDYSQYGTAVNVNLGDQYILTGVTYLARSAPGVNNGQTEGMIGIESVTGSSGNDVLIGSNGDNTIKIWSN